MTALLPRIFPEMSEWFDVGFPFRGSLIRIEDVLRPKPPVLRGYTYTRMLSPPPQPPCWTPSGAW